MKSKSAIVVSSAAILLSGCSSLARRAVLPGSYLKPPQSILAESPRYELLTLHTATGTKIVAQFGRALDKSGQPLTGRRPTVVFFYGNRMCLAGSQEIFEDFRLMGVNILIPEYPGYGMSEGIASERECYSAADAALGHLLQRPDIDRDRIVIAGLSIGCGPAVDLASRNRVAGLIMVVPLSSIREIGLDLAPWYLHWAVPLLAERAAFDNLAKIRNVECPILMVRASHDQVTSPKRSDELVEAAKNKVESIVVEANHDGSWRAGRSEMARWLNALFPSDLAERKKRPNQSPEPMGVSVTPRARARVAPSTTVAHR